MSPYPINSKDGRSSKKSPPIEMHLGPNNPINFFLMVFVLARKMQGRFRFALNCLQKGGQGINQILNIKPRLSAFLEISSWMFEPFSGDGRSRITSYSGGLRNIGNGIPWHRASSGGHCRSGRARKKEVPLLRSLKLEIGGNVLPWMGKKPNRPNAGRQ